MGRTDIEAETPVLWPPDAKSCLFWKDADAGKDWGQVGGEGDDRGWDCWMASLTQWTWVWVNSGSWWWTGRPGVLRFMGLQRVGHDWVTELNWTEEHSWFSSTGRRWEGESGGEKGWSYFHLVTPVDRSCFKRKLTQVRKQCWEMKGYQILLTSFEYIHPTVSETSPLYLYTSGFPFFSSQFLFFLQPKEVGLT